MLCYRFPFGWPANYTFIIMNQFTAMITLTILSCLDNGILSKEIRYGQAGVTSGGSGLEMAVANMKSIANKPIRLSYPETAGLPLVGVAPWKVLTEDIGLSIINSPS